MSKQPLIDQLDIAISQIVADPGVEIASADAAVLDLLGVARDLRELPRPDFKARLKAELERKASMGTEMTTKTTTEVTTKTVVYRPGFRTVTPYLLPPNEGFIDFLKNVFGAVQTERTDTSPTSFHAEAQIGDSMLMMGVGSGRSMPAMLQVYVPNADEVYERALAAGSTSLLAISEDYGDRYGVVEDPAGNQWVIATRLGAHYIPENLHTITGWFHPRGASQFIDFLERAFRAEELERYDSPEGWVRHAKIRIGDSVVALSEPHDDWKPMPMMVYLYVPNVDELYAQALRAGAKSLSEPKDQSYGDRSAGVQDEWGNMWYMATPL
jgi:PhnB protein